MLLQPTPHFMMTMALWLGLFVYQVIHEHLKTRGPGRVQSTWKQIQALADRGALPRLSLGSIRSSLYKLQLPQSYRIWLVVYYIFYVSVIEIFKICVESVDYTDC